MEFVFSFVSFTQFGENISGKRHQFTGLLFQQVYWNRQKNQFGYRLTFISAPSDNETVNESEVPITWFSHFHYIYELIYVRKVIQFD